MRRADSFASKLSENWQSQPSERWIANFAPYFYPLQVIALMDYGSGNLRSVYKALCFLGADVKLVTKPEELNGSRAMPKGAARNSRRARITFGNSAGASFRDRRRRKAPHCNCLFLSAPNSSVRARRSWDGIGVARRWNVARIADARAAPSNSNSLVRLVLTNTASRNRGRVEDQAIVHDRRFEDLSELLRDGLGSGVAESEQVEVPSRAMRRRPPKDEEHRPLQNHGGRVFRHREAVQESLDPIANEQVVEVLASFAREIEEPLFHGGGDVHGRAGHARLSMYGRMTRSIRRRFAMVDMSSMLAALRLVASRRASMAISSPILLR